MKTTAILICTAAVLVAAAPKPQAGGGPTVSLNGVCGSTTGFTCLGSTFGKCCNAARSRCGNNFDDCVSACSPLFGQCNFPIQGPAATSAAPLAATSSIASPATSAASSTAACQTITGQFAIQGMSNGWVGDGKFAQLQQNPAYPAVKNFVFTASDLSMAQRFSFEPDCTLISAGDTLMTYIDGAPFATPVFGCPDVATAEASYHRQWEELKCSVNAATMVLKCSAFGRSWFDAAADYPGPGMTFDQWQGDVTLKVVQ